MAIPGRTGLRALLLTLSLTIACATATQAADADKPAMADPALADIKGTWHRLDGDATVGRYTSIPWGFSTASYWIEGPEGVILVDTQFLPSATQELVTIAEHVTGKKVVLAVVLHPNPDKFNGTAFLQARGIEVITSQQVLDAIPEVHKKRVFAFYERYQPDYPWNIPQPTAFGAQNRTLSAGGVELNLVVAGAGCSDAHVYLQYKDHVFVGDLIGERTHAWLEIGRPDAWLERLDEVEALHPAHVHPGRGESGGPELIAQQRDYLEKVIEVVAYHHPTLPVDDDAVAAARAELEAAYPDYAFPVFLRIGLPAVFERQAGAAP